MIVVVGGHVDDVRPVVVSPHLDDAVLSAWSALVRTARPIKVVTVFAGIPDPGFVTDLDRAHGATESAAWLRRRRAEDVSVLAATGCEVVHLDLLEVQFPAYEMPTVRGRIARDPAAFLRVVQDEPSLHTDRDMLVQLLDEHVRNAPLVFGPAGIGGHPDHRDLAKAVAGIALPGQEVRLYADSPYYLFHGRPSFLADRPAPEADAWVDAALASVLPIPARPAPTVVRLDDDELAAKQRALSGYATELSSIAFDMARLGIAADDLRYEAFWTLPHAPD